MDLQRPLDGNDRPVDAGAVSARIGQQDTSTLISHGTHGRCVRRRAFGRDGVVPATTTARVYW
jgi:hypothetical protein